jgi:hypothetical protein
VPFSVSKCGLLLCAVLPCLGQVRPEEPGCEAGWGGEVAPLALFSETPIAAALAKPAVISRTDWGCPDGQGSRWTPQYTTVTHLIVHHSATANSSSDWAATVRSIWNFHALTNNGGRGWGDIGYNYLIDPNGVIYEGRAGGDNAIGAHFSCQNGGTMGVCMLGTFTSVSPTTNALNSLKRILAWKAEQRSLDPTNTSYHAGSHLTLPIISGHRHGNPAYPTYTCTTTSCPGDNLYNQLVALRAEVDRYIDNGGGVPLVSTLPATLVTSSSARIWGRVNDSNGSAIIERRVEWGLAGSWGGFSSNVVVAGSDFYHDLTGLTSATQYQFRVWARNSAGWNSNGPAFFNTPVARPPNDYFTNRIALAGSLVTLATTNVNATKEFMEPNHGGNAGGRSVWWSWTAPFTGRATLTTAGSSFDTLLGIYTGGAVNALSTMTSNDNDGTNLTSRASFNCVAGVPYPIAVDGKSGAFGNIVLRLAAQPRLDILPSSNHVILTWTNAATGFVLESSDTLAGTWDPGPIPFVVAGQNHVTNSVDGISRFYRLHRP